MNRSYYWLSPPLPRRAFHSVRKHYFSQAPTVCHSAPKRAPVFCTREWNKAVCQPTARACPVRHHSTPHKPTVHTHGRVLFLLSGTFGSSKLQGSVHWRPRPGTLHHSPLSKWCSSPKFYVSKLWILDSSKLLQISYPLSPKWSFPNIYIFLIYIWKKERKIEFPMGLACIKNPWDLVK